jgi:hypothetical protein
MRLCPQFKSRFRGSDKEVRGCDIRKSCRCKFFVVKNPLCTCLYRSELSDYVFHFTADSASSSIETAVCPPHPVPNNHVSSLLSAQQLPSLKIPLTFIFTKYKCLAGLIVSFALSFVTVYGVRTSHVPRGGEMVLLLIVMSTFFTYHDHRYIM